MHTLRHLTFKLFKAWFEGLKVTICRSSSFRLIIQVDVPPRMISDIQEILLEKHIVYHFWQRTLAPSWLLWKSVSCVLVLVTGSQCYLLNRFHWFIYKWWSCSISYVIVNQPRVIFCFWRRRGIPTARRFWKQNDSIAVSVLWLLWICVRIIRVKSHYSKSYGIHTPDVSEIWWDQIYC